MVYTNIRAALAALATLAALAALAALANLAALASLAALAALASLTALAALAVLIRLRRRGFSLRRNLCSHDQARAQTHNRPRGICPCRPSRPHAQAHDRTSHGSPRSQL